MYEVPCHDCPNNTPKLRTFTVLKLGQNYVWFNSKIGFSALYSIYADMAYICIKYDGLIMAGFEDGCFW
jgi:hypothetical protein